MSIEEGIDNLLGFDKRKQILDLWYELFFQKALFSELLLKLPQGPEIIEIDQLIKARTYAQEALNEKFPNLEITFKSPETPIDPCKS